jgi:hypothetical protein
MLGLARKLNFTLEASPSDPGVIIARLPLQQG